jgi:hypothetical protein
MAGPAHAAHVSAHAMVHTCCTPSAEMERVFREAARLHADYIRVDVELHGDLAGVDEVTRLSRRFRLPVLGILVTPPDFTDAREFGRLAGEAAERAGPAIGHWEVLNEPDADFAFRGTPEQYARMLSAAHDAIKAREPNDRIVLGGLLKPRETGWLARVFAMPGADALHKFDVGALHLRGPVELVVNRYREFGAWLRGRGFRGPVWVTEHGYSADPAFQNDPAYTGGEEPQAAYLTESLVGLGEAGAPEVFVTLRDNPELLPVNAEEGIAGRPAFAAVRRVADRWDLLMGWRKQQREEQLQAFVALGDAQAELRDATAARRRGRLDRDRAFLAGARVAFLWHTAAASWKRRRAETHAAAAELLEREIAWKPPG